MENLEPSRRENERREKEENGSGVKVPFKVSLQIIIMIASKHTKKTF